MSGFIYAHKLAYANLRSGFVDDQKNVNSRVNICRCERFACTIWQIFVGPLNISIKIETDVQNIEMLSVISK